MTPLLKFISNYRLDFIIFSGVFLSVILSISPNFRRRPTVSNGVQFLQRDWMFFEPDRHLVGSFSCGLILYDR